MLGLGAAGVLTGARIQSAFSKVLGQLTAHDPTGLSTYIPAAGRFRIYSVTNSLPHRADEEYRLDVGGLVDRPMQLSLADLKALPATHLVKDFQCVTGWRVAGVKWSGVKLADLLDHVGAQAKGKALLFFSFDAPYTESLTIDQARRPDVIVAYAMDGDTVSQMHGGPVRMYIAPMYGYKSTKWLASIDVVDKVIPGYWEVRGYDVDAWIGRSNGRSDEPV
ncbi:MAG: molybdopterin-dependent oxidoreductase [Actinobacteria bacterium]|nr:molybdopterin-dependent oxidoreductase [Actinomycetota bacterium]